eukprot:6205757-Pleurochrysis_carterae.AAC.3
MADAGTARQRPATCILLFPLDTPSHSFLRGAAIAEAVYNGFGDGSSSPCTESKRGVAKATEEACCLQTRCSWHSEGRVGSVRRCKWGVWGVKLGRRRRRREMRVSIAWHSCAGASASSGDELGTAVSEGRGRKWSFTEQDHARKKG